MEQFTILLFYITLFMVLYGISAALIKVKIIETFLDYIFEGEQ